MIKKLDRSSGRKEGKTEGWKDGRTDVIGRERRNERTMGVIGRKENRKKGRGEGRSDRKKVIGRKKETKEQRE